MPHKLQGHLSVAIENLEAAARRDTGFCPWSEAKIADVLLDLGCWLDAIREAAEREPRVA